jgi:hypothetical protein
MERINQLLKDPQKVSLLTAVLFLGGILVSAYFLFRLPNDLVYKGGMTTTTSAGGVYAKAFAWVGITMVLGMLAINQAMKVKKEIIVFKEKDAMTKQEENAKAEQSFAIDMQSFKNAIKNEKGLNAWQTGLNSICHLLQAGQGALYKISSEDGRKLAELANGFALIKNEGEIIRYQSGEGLIGQALASGKNIYLDELPEGYQQQIVSGLGTAVPKYIFIAAIKKENEVKAILEVATFAHLPEQGRKQAEEMAQLLLEKI